MGIEKVRKATALVAISCMALLSTGCAFVEDTAADAANQLTDAASKEIVRQACAPVQDGTIDASELRVLSSIVKSVQGGGLPQDLVDVLQELANSGDQAPEALQQRLIGICDEATV
ncbi:hypothetical protein ABZ820_25310 [Streptomyces diacarni]|uniref:hypothetical protein n=2 Tax=Actinomycetes TaxID=1760 RepID=UPI0010617D28